ncbi:major facilitator superfamily domain-containing protein [Rhodotorula diobovata]|uniref:Major facilitator superfamily domain-containing protein n=1 Tax=Rhodotorula diobovata TaxID=5288 RepID=A0A5C5FKI7_9BASI|nr:major facilitator superfamily domain-containing protein [Rhodotorula diobovata]
MASPPFQGAPSRDPPHPHHLAEQLPPASFEAPSSEHTTTAEPTETTEKADLSVDGGEGGLSLEDGVAAGSQAEKAAAPTLDDYPDGGLRAWSVVGGAWCISFTSWGYTNAFGVFQTYYQDHQLSEYSHSDISWIGSLQLALVLACAIFVGKAFDAGYVTWLLCGAACCWTAGMFGFSEATQYWQVFLGQGVACGLGAGIAFIPAASSVSHWFKRRRALALGILATGSSFGGASLASLALYSGSSRLCAGIIYPIMLNHLFPRVGFGWTVRAAGFLTLAMLITAILTIRSRLPPRKVTKIFDFSPLREKAFLLVTLGETIIMLALYSPYFYIQDYALEHGISSNLALYSLSILNAASIFGRIIPNWLADTYGPLTILVPQCFISGVLIFLFLPMCKTAGGLVAFTILFGFSSGAYVSMMPPLVASLTKDMRTLGHRTSTLFLVVSVAALTGTPITGAIISRSDGSYVAAMCVAGSLTLVGSCFNAAAWWVVSREKGTRWV